MKEYIRFSLVLFVIAGLASGILAYVNSISKPIIDENQKKAEIAARKSVLPEASDFTGKNLNGFKYFVGIDKNKKPVGYTFIAYGPGYSSTVQTMVGVKPDLSIENIQIIYQSETPGLGANCVKPYFQKQFSGMTIASLAVDKDGGKVVSLTGATISSRAITKSIKAGLLELQKAVKSGKSGGSK